MQHVGDHIEVTEEEAKSANRGMHVLTILAVSVGVAVVVLGAIWAMWTGAH